ncbi:MULTISPECIES: chloride channel protein [Bifidobacterium]|uniref:chloride channel protein n=1 Tax=Bifidobacterium TaxID=1678 RepID=UPI001F0A7311|nr:MULTISPECIES: chloride channel protein [Bifidobacterium]
MDWKRLGWMTAAALVLGSIIGIGAGLLTLLLYGIEHLMLGYIEGAAMSGPFDVPSVRRAISVTIGLSIAGVIWWLLRTKTTKVPSVKKAVAGDRMPLWQTIVHVCLQIFIVGTGASIGREVAPRELGAMLAQRFCDLFRLDGLDRRVAVAVAAGAGLGGVYNAPFAGMFFAVEILLADVAIENVAFGLGMSAVAAFVAASVKGRHVFYDISLMQNDLTPTIMLAALLIGAACGVAGAWFRRGSQWAESHKPSGMAILWQMPLAGVLTGLIAIVIPQIMGNGRAAAQLGFSTVSLLQGAVLASGGDTEANAVIVAEQGASAGEQPVSPWALLGLDSQQSQLAIVLLVLVVTLIAKAAATLLTIRSGASGGVLQPGIALGATLGAMVGVLWTLAFPADSVTACALIGAAALLSASQQAPLMAMCLVLELTAAPSAFYVPVALGVAVSAFLSRHLLHTAPRQERADVAMRVAEKGVYGRRRSL